MVAACIERYAGFSRRVIAAEKVTMTPKKFFDKLFSIAGGEGTGLIGDAERTLIEHGFQENKKTPQFQENKEYPVSQLESALGETLGFLGVGASRGRSIKKTVPEISETKKEFFEGRQGLREWFDRRRNTTQQTVRINELPPSVQILYEKGSPALFQVWRAIDEWFEKELLEPWKAEETQEIDADELKRGLQRDEEGEESRKKGRRKEEFNKRVERSRELPGWAKAKPIKYDRPNPHLGKRGR